MRISASEPEEQQDRRSAEGGGGQQPAALRAIPHRHRRPRAIASPLVSERKGAVPAGLMSGRRATIVTAATRIVSSASRSSAQLPAVERGSQRLPRRLASVVARCRGRGPRSDRVDRRQARARKDEPRRCVQASCTSYSNPGKRPVERLEPLRGTGLWHIRSYRPLAWRCDQSMPGTGRHHDHLRDPARASRAAPVRVRPRRAPGTRRRAWPPLGARAGTASRARLSASSAVIAAACCRRGPAARGSRSGMRAAPLGGLADRTPPS